MDERATSGGSTACRGVRGATTLAGVGADEVGPATEELLDRILEANGGAPEDVAAVIFTLTDDLAGANPAAAARAHGWDAVPMLMVREHAADTVVPRCVRVLVLLNTALPRSNV